MRLKINDTRVFIPAAAPKTRRPGLDRRCPGPTSGPVASLGLVVAAGWRAGAGPAGGARPPAGPHRPGAIGQPPSLGERAAEQELDLGIGAAQLVAQAHLARASWTAGSSRSRMLLRSVTVGSVAAVTGYRVPVLTTGWVACSLHRTTSRLETIEALRSWSSSTTSSS